MARATGKPPVPQTEPEKRQAEFSALLHKARRGDQAAAEAIFEKLGPERAREFALGTGHMGRNAEDALLQSMYGEEDKLLQECGRRRLVEQRQKLAGPNPSPLESLLASRIACCELVLHYCEWLYWRNLKGMTWEASDHYQKRLDRAHRRYLSSIMALAQVRKLLTPAVQVNIGEKQVNLVQTGGQQNLPASPTPAALDPPAVAADLATPPVADPVPALLEERPGAPL